MATPEDSFEALRRRADQSARELSHFSARFEDMHYRIEYLTETTDADSICASFDANAKDLGAAEGEALENSGYAKTAGATGFQVRHVNAVDEIISIVNFER